MDGHNSYKWTVNVEKERIQEEMSFNLIYYLASRNLEYAFILMIYDQGILNNKIR